jgi:hypothetical protein
MWKEYMGITVKIVRLFDENSGQRVMGKVDFERRKSKKVSS